MILDKQLQFSDAQAVTATAISTNVVDTLPGANNPNLTQNLGGFQGAFLVVQTSAAFVGGTSIAISLESDSTANLATSPTIHYNSGAIPIASLGPTFYVAIPLPYGAYEKFLGLRYTVVGTPTQGAFNAFITRDVQAWQAYATAGAPNA
jgi:hypothetical protein